MAGGCLLERRGPFARGRLPITGWAHGSTAIYRWHDLAWAENLHRLHFYYWDTTLNPPDWTYVTYYDYTGFGGTHMYTEDRIMGAIFDREQWGKPPGDYRACAWPWFPASQTWGNGRCSMTVTLE